MRMKLWMLLAIASAFAFPSSPLAADDAAKFTFVHSDDRVSIRLGEQEVAQYVFRDDAVTRPYFAHVKTPSGVQVTRHHPPIKNEDATDHAEMHPGIWLSFGDLNGQDYWRLKARTEHVRFIESQPLVRGAGFSVVNRYLTADGAQAVCEETCHLGFSTFEGGYLIDWRSEFRPAMGELAFGDQEEMGLGMRVATQLAVDRKQGGRMLDDTGRRGADKIWGQTVQWCDYAGPLAGRWVGMTAMAGPENFRPSWAHSRDYGFLALNPFGKKAFTQQDPPSRITVQAGATLPLHYGIAVHESASESDYQPAKVFSAFSASAARKK
jgi:hypothetical protein